MANADISLMANMLRYAERRAEEIRQRRIEDTQAVQHQMSLQISETFQRSGLVIDAGPLQEVLRQLVADSRARAEAVELGSSGSGPIETSLGSEGGEMVEGNKGNEAQQGSEEDPAIMFMRLIARKRSELWSNEDIQDLRKVTRRLKRHVLEQSSLW